MMKNTNIKCIILDDEKNCVEVLAYEIRRVDKEVDIIGQFTDPLEAIDFLSSETVDILFLDIEMPILNGFQFLERLIELPLNIVFTTAFDHYALKAFRYYALDYLLKPIDKDLLKAALQRARVNNVKYEKSVIKEIHTQLKAPNSVFKKIAVPVVHGYKMIQIADIVHCDASSNYAIIHNIDRSSVMISKPLKYLDKLLKEHGFFRIHQSTLINVNYIDSYLRSDGGVIQLTNGTKFNVSRSNKLALETFLMNFSG